MNYKTVSIGVWKWITQRGRRDGPMKVCVLAARKRNNPYDQELLEHHVQMLMDKYPQLKIISGSCDRGVGKIIKNLCLPEEKGPRPPAQFPFIELHVRPYLPKGRPELTNTEFAEIFSARNAFFNEYCEEFHLFLDGESPRGMMADIYNRVRMRNAPVALYRPGDREPKEAMVMR